MLDSEDEGTRELSYADRPTNRSTRYSASTRPVDVRSEAEVAERVEQQVAAINRPEPDTVELDTERGTGWREY